MPMPLIKRYDPMKAVPKKMAGLMKMNDKNAQTIAQPIFTSQNNQDEATAQRAKSLIKRPRQYPPQAPTAAAAN